MRDRVWGKTRVVFKQGGLKEMGVMRKGGRRRVNVRVVGFFG